MERELGIAEPSADAAQNAVGKRHQRDESQHHRAHRHRQLDARLRALGGGLDDVGGLVAFLKGLGDLIRHARLDQRRRTFSADPRLGQGQFALRLGRGVAFVGHDDLGHQDATGSRHEGGGEQERQIPFTEQPRIGGEDRPRDARHADGHEREQPARSQRGEIRAHHQRAFRLADEDVRRRAQRFDAADAGHPADSPAHPAHHPLHDAEVVKDRDQSGEEHDHRQRAQRERVCERVLGAEQELGPLAGVAQQRRDAIGHALDHEATAARCQHQERHQRLQGEGGRDNAQLDAPLAHRQQESDRQDREDAEQVGDDRRHSGPFGGGTPAHRGICKRRLLPFAPRSSIWAATAFHQSIARPS